MTRKILLICGILSSLLYVAMNIFVPPQFEGYSAASQTVSELSAIGAPTRPIWVPWGVVYTLLFTAFGFGVRMSANQNDRLRIIGNLIIIYGVISVAWPLAPMHLRGAEFAFTDAMHITLGIITILLMLIIIALGAAALGKRFRLYSILTIVIFIAFGTLTGIDSPGIAKNQPTPWIGVWERINIGTFMLWIIILGIMLLQTADLQLQKRRNIIVS
ncbi:MAG: DUF998 domain-containing protein [Chitinophagales bacterium]